MLEEKAKKQHAPNLSRGDGTTSERPAKKSKTLFTFMGEAKTINEDLNDDTIDSYLHVAASCLPMETNPALNLLETKSHGMPIIHSSGKGSSWHSLFLSAC